MIDIVIPFYNDLDTEWKKVLNKYMLEENSSDRQVIGEERYRDSGCGKYWFRCIEENCKWVNKIFVLISSKTQMPDWLNTDNPKIRVVLHEEFIPKELLPTFNTMTIELFISRIPDLSNNYIYCNDDYYFLNPTSEFMYFVNDIPVYTSHCEELKKFDDDYLNGSDSTFYSALNNGMDLQLKISGDKAKWYAIDHIPVAHKKDFEKQIIDEYYNMFVEANKKSRFRHKDNYSNHVFICLYKDLKPYYKYDYNKSYYVTMRADIDFKEHENCKAVCFNDTEQLSNEDFIEVKKRMIDFFENKFPKKSSFER